MSEPTAAPTAVDPSRNPSYPQRVHIRERAHWQAVLAEWDAKITAAQHHLGGKADTARLSGQIAGARDQMADAVKRLPMEVGEMYEEDKQRLEEAVAALGRLMAKV